MDRQKELFHKIESGEISVLDAAKELKISRATANRRYATFKKELEDPSNLAVSNVESRRDNVDKVGNPSVSSAIPSKHHLSLSSDVQNKSCDYQDEFSQSRGCDLSVGATYFSQQGSSSSLHAISLSGDPSTSALFPTLNESRQQDLEAIPAPSTSADSIYDFSPSDDGEQVMGCEDVTRMSGIKESHANLNDQSDASDPKDRVVGGRHEVTDLSMEKQKYFFDKVLKGELSLLGAARELQLNRSSANRDFSQFKKDVEEKQRVSESDEETHEDLHVDNDVSDIGDNTFLPGLQFDANDVTHMNHSLCNVNCVHDLVEKIGYHSKVCTGILVRFKEFSLPKSHCGFTSFLCLYKCFKCERTIEFSSSPLVDKRPVSDFITLHSKLTSGGVWENVERFTDTLGFSCDFSGDFLTKEFEVDKYCQIINEFANESMRIARERVIVGIDQIDTTTDASHQNRTNSANSCVTMLSPDTLEVLFVATVSRSEESISQNHEKVGTQKLCQEVKRVDLKIRANTTDQGSASRLVISKEFPPPLGITQFDPYHGYKSSKKEIKKCTEGKFADRGNTWHEELSDKCDALVEHLRWAVDECKITVDEYQDPVQLEAAKKKLQSRILVPLKHYQDDHQNCSPSSRCNLDPKYRLSRRKVTDPAALRMMQKSLTSTVIFKNPEKFILVMPTSMNECYHNRQTKYLSKRVHLSAKLYRMCIDLAICDHNENLAGVFRDGKRIEPLPVNSDGLPKLPVESRTFVTDIWMAYIRARMET